MVIPKDVDLFVEKLWDAIPGFMSEELLEEAGHDEMSAADIWEAGSDYLDQPEKAPAVLELVKHARAILATMPTDEDGEDDEDSEEEDD